MRQPQAVHLQEYTQLTPEGTLDLITRIVVEPDFELAETRQLLLGQHGTAREVPVNETGLHLRRYDGPLQLIDLLDVVVPLLLVTVGVQQPLLPALLELESLLVELEQRRHDKTAFGDQRGFTLRESDTMKLMLATENMAPSTPSQ